MNTSIRVFQDVEYFSQRLQDKHRNPFVFVAVLATRYLFWTEWGQNPCIGRSRLDGSDQVTLVNSGVMWPNDISIDYEVKSVGPTYRLIDVDLIFCPSAAPIRLRPVASHIHFQIASQENTLYWCDARTDKIERINLETGEGREIILSSANADLFSVAVFGPYIYWADRYHAPLFLQSPQRRADINPPLERFLWRAESAKDVLIKSV